MKAAIIGYGKMGREIEKVLLERGHHVALIIDQENSHELDPEHMQGVDVALEFTTPKTAYDNIRKMLDMGVAVVSGTTGWIEHLPEIHNHCLATNSAFFYASNYSLGVNLLFRLNRRLAQLMKSFPQYDVKIQEIHHTEKRDAPSGTAITLAEAVIEEIGRKKSWVNNPTENSEELEIESLREGMIPGIHTVTYSSEVDSLELRHEIKSRRTLAEGAVIAAEFLCGKRGVFTMDDLLK
ncbi:MAG: 4-hydroxy-tetrahydrodipicolinate reductase [Alistipes sp.]|nr:4-hydroxy-tetrahydrodipicolinate reductase [Alistipes sp.]